MQPTHLIVRLLLIRCFLSSLFRETKKYNDISSFLINNKLYSRRNEVLEIGVFLFNSTEADSTFKQWISNTHSEIGGVKIVTEVPENVYMPTKFSDSIIFLDYLNEHTSTKLQPLLNQSKIWDQESRYILVLTSNFKEDEEILKDYVKLLWTDARLINFLVVCTDSFDKLQLLSYNPFKDEILNFTTLKNYTSAELFPNKVKHLYGYTLNVSYTVSKPFVYKKDNKMVGIDYDFIMTFLKAINASVRTIEKQSYTEAANEMFFGSADIAAIAMFLFEESMEKIAYPHGFMDNVVLVKKPDKVPPLASLVQVFDVYTWAMIIATLMIFKGCKLLWARIYSGGEEKMFGIKILTIAFAIFSIIIMQVIQSLITTFLIHPKPVKIMNTINDLANSKLPIHVFRLWEPHLTRQLADQYILEDEDYFAKIMNGTASGGGYVVPNVQEEILVRRKYHQIQEPIGSNYMMYYLGQHSPYKVVLKDIVLRALAYGLYSKEWGTFKLNTLSMQEFTSLKLSHLEDVFMMWHVGIILSIIAFIVELLWHYWIIRYRRNC